MNRSTNPDRIGMWEYTDAVNRMKLSPLITRFGVKQMLCIFKGGISGNRIIIPSYHLKWN